MKIFGQEKAIGKIDLIVKDSFFKPVLFLGPSGYGKTYFAKYVGYKTGKNLVNFNCSFSKDGQEFLRKILSLTANDILFLDEIHSLPSALQENLYSVIDDRKIILEGSEVNVAAFCIVAATTNEGKLNEALLNRFVYDIRLEEYTDIELSNIISAYANQEYAITVDNQAAISLAHSSRGCPRLCKKRVDWLSKTVKGSADQTAVTNLMSVLDIDKNYLEKKDREYLSFLLKQKHPVSLKTICQKLKLTEDTVVDYIESFLVQKDLITKSSRGRSVNLVNLKSLLHGI